MNLQYKCSLCGRPISELLKGYWVHCKSEDIKKCYNEWKAKCYPDGDPFISAKYFEERYGIVDYCYYSCRQIIIWKE